MLSSWPRTRIRRCQACRSSSRSGRETSARTRSRWGAPPWRKALVRISQRPEPPGNAASRIWGTEASRNGARPTSSARRPSRRGSGCASSVSPKRFTSLSSPASSNAKTATSISAMTLESKAVASSAPSRCSRRVAASALTSRSTSPSGSSERAPRARIEKSSSRIAASRFDTVWRGRTTRSRRAWAKPRNAMAIAAVSVHRSLGVKSPVQSRARATITPGSAAAAARRTTRRSCVRGLTLYCPCFSSRR